MANFPPFLESLPKGTWNPEQGVEAEKGKGSKQKYGHAPERIVEVWIFFPVMVGGMSQIAGEFPI